jgi:antitoxin ParD1/3/4
MNVALSSLLEEVINRKVASGLYGSATEVISDALWLMEERDRLYEARLQQLREDVAVGLTQADEGCLVPLDVEAIRSKARQQFSLRQGMSGSA